MDPHLHEDRGVRVRQPEGVTGHAVFEPALREHPGQGAVGRGHDLEGVHVSLEGRCRQQAGGEEAAIRPDVEHGAQPAGQLAQQRRHLGLEAVRSFGEQHLALGRVGHVGPEGARAVRTAQAQAARGRDAQALVNQAEGRLGGLSKRPAPPAPGMRERHVPAHQGGCVNQLDQRRSRHRNDVA